MPRWGQRGHVCPDGVARMSRLGQEGRKWGGGIQVWGEEEEERGFSVGVCVGGGG